MLIKEAHHNLKASISWGPKFKSRSTQTVGEGQRQFLDVPYVKPTICNELCFAQFHAKIHKIKKTKQEKDHCEVNTLFIGVNIINFYVIIYHWKGQPFICEASKTIFIRLREEVITFERYKKIRVISLA